MLAKREGSKRLGKGQSILLERLVGKTMELGNLRFIQLGAEYGAIQINAEFYGTVADKSKAPFFNDDHDCDRMI